MRHSTPTPGYRGQTIGVIARYAQQWPLRLSREDVCIDIER
jgi:hypothetical protein